MALGRQFWNEKHVSSCLQFQQRARRRKEKIKENTEALKTIKKNSVIIYLLFFCYYFLSITLCRSVARSFCTSLLVSRASLRSHCPVTLRLSPCDASTLAFVIDPGGVLTKLEISNTCSNILLHITRRKCRENWPRILFSWGTSDFRVVLSHGRINEKKHISRPRVRQHVNPGTTI